MNKIIGFAGSIDLNGIEALHRAKVIFTADESAPDSFGRAKVLKLGHDPEIWRYGGISVVYGEANPGLLNVLRKQATPLLVLVSDAPVGGSKTPQILERLVLAGKTVVQIVIEDDTIMTLVGHDGAAEINDLGIPTEDS